MLLCGIRDIEPGMNIAAAVMHPSRPDTELIKPGVTLNAKMLSRLRDFGVERVWIDHDATADLDQQIGSTTSAAHKEVYSKLKDGLRKASQSTISAGDIVSYKQAVMDLVCELMGNPALATLADRMTQCNAGEPFRHGSNVAYLSILIGLQMELYIIKQRPKLSTDNARDLTALGIGAMLHDIGKLAETSDDARAMNVLTAKRAIDTIGPDDVQAHESFKPIHSAYREHCVAGYRMLESANAPASSRQIVLTHHMRWSEQGFPDMEEVTRGRKLGTQQGESIHIFSRIVAAADLLDHLLQEAKQANKPAVVALKAFSGKTFEGWLDPVIQDAVLRTVPPFPVGSHIRLSNGCEAVVTAPNPVQPCLPTIRLLGKESVDASSQTLELAEHREVTITHLLGESVENDIFLLPEREPLAKTIAQAS